MQRNDNRDWFIMGTVGAAWAAATVYMFIHPSVAVFGAWCGLCATMIGSYHYLNLRDQKEADADGHQ